MREQRVIDHKLVEVETRPHELAYLRLGAQRSTEVGTQAAPANAHLLLQLSELTEDVFSIGREFGRQLLVR